MKDILGNEISVGDDVFLVIEDIDGFKVNKGWVMDLRVASSAGTMSVVSGNYEDGTVVVSPRGQREPHDVSNKRIIVDKS